MTKELRRMNTGYEDGTCWVEFKTDEGRITYELAEDFDEEIELSEDKINIEDLPISMYVENILTSEDDMYSIFYDEEDEDSIEEFEEVKELIEETINMYPDLEEYIEIIEHEEITFCGGLITKVLF